MDKQEAKQRINKLKKVIGHHRYLYHVLDRQEISDSALDSLKKELFDLEEYFPEFVTSDSPTQRVSGKPLEKFKKVKHENLMLSFNDAFSRKDMENWLEKISKLLTEEERKNIDFYCELKIDGLAAELVYENGSIKTGSTRGDGKIGEDITQNLKIIEAIPLSLRKESGFLEKIIIRGEVFISKKEFEKVNRQREKLKESIYANPRNLAAGSVRQLDSKITAKRSLDFFAYDLITDYDLKKHEDKHNKLKELGFKINKHNKYCKDLNEVFDFYNYCQNLREKLYYEIDGLVIVINSNKIFAKLGVVGKAPRGAIAFKFPAKQATTVIEDIKIQVGRTGALTPVAYLKPVKIGGAIVSRATLHNEDEIKRLGIKIGDTVIVSRAGDVIPDVVKVLKDLRNGKEKDFKMPGYCPVCDSKTKRKSGEAVHYCTNSNCFAVQKKLFYHFVSKPAFNIEGLGPKIIDQLISEGLVSDPADLFQLKEGDLVPLERFADKSAENLVKAVSQSKEIELSRFIYSLGIRNVGEETAYDLAGQFNSLEEIKKTELEELEKIADIGPVVAKSIYNWFRLNRNVNLLEKLKKSRIKIKNQGSEIKNQKLKGLAFVLTGELEGFTRDEAKDRIRKLAGDISSSVSKETDYVVFGKDPGSKYDKAKKLGIKIIDEKRFVDLLK